MITEGTCEADAIGEGMRQGIFCGRMIRWVCLVRPLKPQITANHPKKCLDSRNMILCTGRLPFPGTFW